MLESGRGGLGDDRSVVGGDRRRVDHNGGNIDNGGRAHRQLIADLRIVGVSVVIRSMQMQSLTEARARKHETGQRQVRC